ncbi:hypothetical protein KKF84_05190 [Myxococcota bacterium]|nr:hypothetical protein [Myxococcota bacterium]
MVLRDSLVLLAGILFVQCTASAPRGRTSKDPALPVPVAKGSRTFAQVAPVLPARAALVLMVRPAAMGQWIVKNLGGKDVSAEAFPATVSSIPLLKELWSKIIAGPDSGVDHKKALAVALYFGDEKGWTASNGRISAWTQKIYETKDKSLYRPAAKSPAHGERAALVRGLSPVRHRVIIPLVDPGAFYALIERKLGPLASKTCPLAPGADTITTKTGVWLGEKVRGVCAKGLLPADLGALPAVFTVDTAKGTATALYVLSDHARVEHFFTPASVPGAGLSLEALLTPLKNNSIAVPTVNDDYVFALNQPLFFAMTHVFARNQLLTMSLGNNTLDTVENFRRLWESINEFPVFAKIASFCADRARVSMNASRKQVEVTWHLSTLGRSIIAPLIAPRWTIVTPTILRNIAKLGRVVLQRRGPYLGKFTTAAMRRCGTYCKYDGLTRLALDYLIPVPTASIDDIVTQTLARITEEYPLATKRLTKMESNLKGLDFTLRFTF